MISMVRTVLVLVFLQLAGSTVAQAAPCPASCGTGLSIHQHGGPTDRYLRLEPQPALANTSYVWEKIDGPEDPFTQFDGLDDPNADQPKVNRMFSRRYQVTASLSGGGTLCACTDVTPYDGSFSFLVVADPQFGVLQPQSSPYLLEARQLDRAVATANRLQPAFVAVVGDLVNTHNNSDQLDTFADRIEHLDKSIPLVLVPGNHDLKNKLTAATLAAYRSEYEIDDRYSFGYGGSRFFVINSTLLDAKRFDTGVDPPDPYWAANGVFVDTESLAHQEWLKGALPPLPGDDHRIVFSHHPLFRFDPDEDSNSSWNIHQNIRSELLGLFRDHQITALFAGHYHKGFETVDNPPAGTAGTPFEMVATARVGHTPDFAGFRIVHVFEDRIEHEFYAVDRTPELIRGASWRYLDTVSNGSMPPPLWQSQSFVDDSWASGTGGLGYGTIPDLNTVVSDGGGFSPNTTTYFRAELEVGDPETYGRYQVDLLRDDGAVVYFNGSEEVRSNMPTGTIGHTSTASTPVNSPQDTEFFSDEVAAGALLPGTNLIAVEVHQANPSGNDLAFDLELRGIHPSVLVELRSYWHYYDLGTTAPAPDGAQRPWFATDYDEDGWLRGESPIGDLDALNPPPGSDCTPDDPEVCGVTTSADSSTTCSIDPADMRTTVYFRREFEVDDPLAFNDYQLNLLVYDGAVVYLNGVELDRPYMPTGAVAHCTLALSSKRPAETYLELKVDPADLVTGTNLLAAEVHRSGLQTSGLVFDLELVGTDPN